MDVLREEEREYKGIYEISVKGYVNRENWQKEESRKTTESDIRVQRFEEIDKEENIQGMTHRIN